MKRFALPVLLALAACGGKPPPPLQTLKLPAGAQLSPYDPTKPGFARPQGLAELDGTVWITLSNQDAQYNPAGPGYLAAMAPFGSTFSLLNIGGAAGASCKNPGSVVAGASKLYVTCGGDFRDGSGAGLAEVDPATRTTRFASLAAGFSVAAAAVAAGPVWAASAFDQTIVPIDRTSLSTGGAITLPCHPGTTGTNFHYAYVPALQVSGSTLWALCATDLDGQSLLVKLDATSGNVLGSAAVVALPTALAPLPDGRVAVISSADPTVQFVSDGPTLTATSVLHLSSQTSTLNDVRALDHFVFTTATGSNTVQKIDLSAQGGPKVVSETNLGANAGPWDILPLDDQDALVTNQLGNTIARIHW